MYVFFYVDLFQTQKDILTEGIFCQEIAWLLWDSDKQIIWRQSHGNSYSISSFLNLNM